jgi:hypothetical protein
MDKRKIVDKSASWFEAACGGDRECYRVGLAAVTRGDPDGDVIPARRFAHALDRMRGK